MGRDQIENEVFKSGQEPSMEDLLKTIEHVIKRETPGIKSSSETKALDSKKSMKRSPNQFIEREPSFSSKDAPYCLGSPLNPGDIHIPPLVLKNPLPRPVFEKEDPYLLSREAFISVTQTFSELSKTITQKTYASATASAGSGTLDSRVMGLLRGLLKEWIDQHMPALVEELVKKELEHIRKSLL